MARKQPSSEPEFRLRPRRPRVPPDESKAWSRSFKNLIHLVRMTSKPAYPSRSGAAPRKPHLQRCAVRVTYSPNRVSGQWAAHGRYISRGSATKEGSVKEAGFTATNDRIDILQTLGQWQSAGDQRLFKLIISPEFGERLDLKRHTRELMARMEQDLDLRLEWVAVAHFNTDHPHVHIALRGRTDVGPLRLPAITSNRGSATMPRTSVPPNWDSGRNWMPSKPSAAEVDALHMTSLDRRIAKEAFGPDGDGISLQNRRAAAAVLRASEHAVYSSLLGFGHWGTLGLSEEIEHGRWQIDAAFLREVESNAHRP